MRYRHTPSCTYLQHTVCTGQCKPSRHVQVSAVPHIHRVVECAFQSWTLFTSSEKPRPVVISLRIYFLSHPIGNQFPDCGGLGSGPGSQVARLVASHYPLLPGSGSHPQGSFAHCLSRGMSSGTWNPPTSRLIQT